MVGNRGTRPSMRIYTRTGDDGYTGLLGSGRVSKDAMRVEVYGTVDELNASLGVARAHGLDARADRLAAQLQDDLFVVGSASPTRCPTGRSTMRSRRGTSDDWSRRSMRWMRNWHR